MEVPLNEEAKLAKEKSKKLLEQLENQKKARTLALPTDDNLIKARLRELSEPIMLFAETKAERRERLRKKLVELGEERGMPIIGLNNKPITEEQKIIQKTEDLQNKLFYFKGKEDLAGIRKRIAMYSFERAAKRVQKETEKRKREAENEDSSRVGDEDMKTSELFDKLKNSSYFTSEIGDVRPLSSCSFSPNGNLISNSSWSGDCRIWNVESGKQTHVLKGHTERAQHVKWIPKRDLSPTVCNLISCGADNVAYLWPLSKDESEMETNEVKTINPLGCLKGHSDRLNRVGMHPSGLYCATTSFDSTWRYWDIERCEELFIQEGHAKAVYGVSFQTDGSLVGTLGLEGVTRIWDLRTGRTVLTFEDHVKKGLCIDFSPNGFHFATGSADNTVLVYDLRKKKQIYNIPAHLNMISNLCFQPEDGKYLVSSSFDKTIKVWSTIDYTPIKTLGGHDGRVSYVDVSVNNHIATVGFDKTLKVAK